MAKVTILIESKTREKQMGRKEKTNDDFRKD
jgi:hypothetical protein